MNRDGGSRVLFPYRFCEGFQEPHSRLAKIMLSREVKSQGLKLL